MARFDSHTLAGLFFLGLAARFPTGIVLAAAMVLGYNFRGAASSDFGVVPETALPDGRYPDRTLAVRHFP